MPFLSDYCFRIRVTSSFFVLLAVVSAAILSGCHSFPEEQSSPFFRMKVDTITVLNGVIERGDSILFSGSIASSTNNNTIRFGIYRSQEQPYEYSGPDSSFGFYEDVQIREKILESVRLRKMVPDGIRPGNYTCFGFAKGSEGAKSDSVKQIIFIRNALYPEMVLDTPFNGLTANHRIDSSNWVNNQKEFRLQVRSFADRMERIELQWFDSLKTTSIGEAMIQNLSSDSGVARLNRLLKFPERRGRKFYLRSIAVTIDNRSLISWIPFERNFAYP